MKKKRIKYLKRGEFFCLREYDDSTTEVKSSLVWVRGNYDSSSKKYYCYKFDDVCHGNFLRGDRVVYSEIYF